MYHTTTDFILKITNYTTRSKQTFFKLPKASMNPDVKRLIGRKFADAEVQRDKKL